jgi:hypothetical protein
MKHTGYGSRHSVVSRFGFATGARDFSVCLQNIQTDTDTHAGTWYIGYQE